ncbi:MAG: DUF5057 domain-containing protein [Phycisphaerae bacterium]|nr:DUF5057 domain-containing protein [Phycisphaerae bacterium]
MVALAVMNAAAVANPIRVLHVSEVMQSEVQVIIDDVGVGGLFEVTQMDYWDEYHNGPPGNLDEYDVIVFGLSDCFDVVRDLDELYSFVEGGGSVMFTHDSASHLSPPSVRSMVGIGDWIEGDETSDGWIWGESSEIIQDHAVLHCPIEIGSVGDGPAIQRTHTLFTLESGDTILSLVPDEGYEPGPGVSRPRSFLDRTGLSTGWNLIAGISDDMNLCVHL